MEEEENFAHEFEKLTLIQKRITEIEAQKKRATFLTNLKYFNLIKETLKERDELISRFNKNGQNQFWHQVTLNYNKFNKIFNTDFPLIEKLTVSLTENYECKIHIKLNENPFVTNKYIHKNNNLLTGESESTRLDFLVDAYPKFFKFFTDEYDDLSYFEMFFEMYINAIEYFRMG
ncbi:hypothetical protein CDIK_1014 [Cucumispora dikerogammari]|nr:hypothetical protein CDIK_1014 [Cucumispora dikerogammari]